MDVVTALRRAAPEVFRGVPVLFAYLFGSHARSQARAGSDIDVAVYVDPEMSAQDRSDLRLSLPSPLEELSGLRGVEVIALNDVPLRLQGRVVGEGVPIFSRDEPRRVAYESLTFREYADLELVMQPMYREVIRQTAEGRR